MKDLYGTARNAAAADIFKTMSSDQKSQEALNQIRASSDAQLDMMASICGIPEAHKPIYRSLVRGEDNIFMQQLKAFPNQLETGDVILMTGTSRPSKILASLQKPLYANARSSHVALVHADYICVDAMPEVGVSNRLISEVLLNVESDWRVIRFNRLEEKNHEAMRKACAFYLEQPYKILPSKKPAKKFSYCSELARKVYFDSNIKGTGIPKDAIVKPCDFDRIADLSETWTDVTGEVKPFVNFCREYEALLKVNSKLFIAGLQLNRARFEERKITIRTAKAAAAKGHIPSEAASDIIEKIHESEKRLHHNFWDSAHS